MTFSPHLISPSPEEIIAKHVHDLAYMLACSFRDFLMLEKTTCKDVDICFINTFVISVLFDLCQYMEDTLGRSHMRAYMTDMLYRAFDACDEVKDIKGTDNHD